MEEARIDEIADAVLARRRLTGQGELRIESSVIEPVVRSQDFCRFEIPRGKGILDSDTAVQISVANSDVGAAGDRSFLPILQGISSTINKAVLRIGGKVIATTEEFHYLAATMAGLVPGDDQASIEENIKGNMFHFKNETQGQESTAGVGGAPNLTINGSVVLGSKMFENDIAATDSVNFQVDPQLLLQPNTNTAINASRPDLLDNTPKFMLRLHELFPFLKSNQLPLFVMPDQAVFVELYFNNPAGVVGSGVVAQNVGNSTYTIVQEDLKLFATYQFFSDEVMNRIQSRYDTQGLSFIYEDYQFLRKGLIADAAAAGSQELVSDLGGQNKVVRDIIIHKQAAGGAAVPGYSGYECQGLYHKTSTAADTCGESYQMEINDRLFFTRPIDEPAALNYYYSTVGDTGDAWIPNVVNSFSSGVTGSGMLTTGCLFESGNMNGLAGSYAPRAFSFRKDRSNAAGNGLLVGSKPIRLIYKRDGSATNAEWSSNNNLSFRIWLVIERGFVLKDGEVAVSG
tara:strand:+ start:3825 stop:5366 length:1542 start_codon:yes stop_codon:yes gene_type:complete